MPYSGYAVCIRSVMMKSNRKCMYLFHTTSDWVWERTAWILSIYGDIWIDRGLITGNWLLSYIIVEQVLHVVRSGCHILHKHYYVYYLFWPCSVGKKHYNMLLYQLYWWPLYTISVARAHGMHLFVYMTTWLDHYEITLWDHPARSPREITLQDHPARSPCEITLRDHPARLPCEITLRDQWTHSYAIVSSHGDLTPWQYVEGIHAVSVFCLMLHDRKNQQISTRVCRSLTGGGVYRGKRV